MTRRATTLVVVLTVLVPMLTLSCSGGGGGIVAGLDLALRLPTGMLHGADADWQVSWTGGTGPYTVEWDFGEGAEPATVVVSNAVSPVITTVEMRNPSLTGPANYTVTVTVSDSQSQSDMGVSAYSVAPANPAPSFSSVDVDAGAKTLAIVLDWPYADAVNVAVNLPGQADALSKSVPSQGGTVTFHLDSLVYDIVTGLSGTANITAADSHGVVVSTEQALNIPGLNLKPDTLYAIPLQTECKVGEEVRVLIATGVPAQPFSGIENIGLTMPKFAAFVPWSYDYGAMDEYPDVHDDAVPLDGIWAYMDPRPYFDDGSQWQWWPSPFDIGGGRDLWELGFTVFSWCELTGKSGALFSVKLAFDAPGICELGFLDREQPYPSSSYWNTSDRQIPWSDVSNDHVADGIPNSITVTE